MNAGEIRTYKIKNVQKTQANTGAAEKTNKTKSSPKRNMADINAAFAVKTPVNIIEEPEKVFFNSLTDLNQNDIVLNAVAKDVKKESADYIRYFALLVCLVIFAYSGYNIAGRLYSYISAAREYDALRDIFFADEDEDMSEVQFLRTTKANIPIQDVFLLQAQTGVRAVESEVNAGMGDVGKKRVNHQKIAEINQDFYCWINVSHTNISYPVVQTVNNDYYLHYSFERKWNNSGAIFADFRNSRNIMENRNTIIYGHNMLDGSMFQPLIDYGRYASYFNEGIIELITEEATYYYEVFSVREADPASGYIKTDFSSDEEYIAFLDIMKEESYYQKDVVFDEETRIITLSTCINDTSRDYRFVVQGIMVDVK